MAVHDKSIPQCPMTVACGPPQTGKTIAIKIGMLMIGIEMLHKDRLCDNITGLGQESCYENCSKSFMCERATCSTLPFVIDYPPSPTNINETIVYFYNKGQSGKSKRGSKTLVSMPIILTTAKQLLLVFVPLHLTLLFI